MGMFVSIVAVVVLLSNGTARCEAIDTLRTGDSIAISTSQQARIVALKYTGFDSTGRTDVVLKKFRLAAAPGPGCNQPLVESNLWLVTFHQLEVVAPGRFQDFKVFLDPRTGMLVELYSLPLDSAPHDSLVLPYATEELVADISTFRPVPPQPCTFTSALSHTIKIHKVESNQLFAICEIDPRVAYNPDLSTPVWTIWGEATFFSIAFPTKYDGRITTSLCQVDAEVCRPYAYEHGRVPPYLREK